MPGCGRIDWLRDGLLVAMRDTVLPREADGFDMLRMRLEKSCES
tara:strand:+ start:894 stop:1025 length:132 start_codon:yes stop_codon:yes gene_type:complete